MMSLPAPPFTFSIPVKISLPSPVVCLLVEPRLMRFALELNSAVSIPLPPTKRSLPKPPLRVSLPLPPINLSFPESPYKVSFPLSPFKMSLPGLPENKSSPSNPKILSSLVEPTNESFSLEVSNIISIIISNLPKPSSPSKSPAQLSKLLFHVAISTSFPLSVVV